MPTVTTNETYELILIPRRKNGSYEYETNNVVKFKGRPASNREVRSYTLQTGVVAHTDSIYIYSSNLPDEIKPGDKVRFLGKDELVESVGYYYDITGIVNASVFSESYIISKCPKGITLNKG